MNATSTLSRKPVVLLLSAVLLSSSGYAVAATPATPIQGAALEEVVTDAGWDSENLVKMTAHTGNEVLHHLNAAKQYLENGQSGKARGNLIAAQRLNYSLIQAMPFVTVSEEVVNAKGKLAMNEVDVFYDQLLPIYSELDEMAVYAPKPARRARGLLRRVVDFVHRGNHKAAMSSLQEVYDEVTETTFYMPVMYVEGQLKAALYALNQPKRDVATAKLAVDNAMGSLEGFSEEVVEVPIKS